MTLTATSTASPARRSPPTWSGRARGRPAADVARAAWDLAAPRVRASPRGRRRLRGREGGRARLHVLPPRALAEDQDEQRAGAREPRDQEEVPLGAVVPLRGVHDAARVRGARRRGGQVGRPPGSPRPSRPPARPPRPRLRNRSRARGSRRSGWPRTEVIREVLDRHGVAE